MMMFIRQWFDEAPSVLIEICFFFFFQLNDLKSEKSILAHHHFLFFCKLTFLP